MKIETDYQRVLRYLKVRGNIELACCKAFYTTETNHSFAAQTSPLQAKDLTYQEFEWAWLCGKPMS